MKTQDEVQLLTADGQVVAAPIVEQTPEEAPLDEYEQSAVMFHSLSKHFRKMVYDLANRKKRAVPRVLEAFLFDPLEVVKLEGQAEENLLGLVRQIMYHKMKISEYAAIKQEEKEKAKNESK